MDLSFHLRAKRMASRTADLRVDFDLLVASLDAQQSQSATARAARARDGRRGPMHRVTELVLGGGDWEEAKRAQGGCFQARSGAHEGDPEGEEKPT